MSNICPFCGKEYSFLRYSDLKNNSGYAHKTDLGLKFCNEQKREERGRWCQKEKTLYKKETWVEKP